VWTSKTTRSPSESNLPDIRCGGAAATSSDLESFRAYPRAMGARAAANYLTPPGTPDSP